MQVLIHYLSVIMLTLLSNCTVSNITEDSITVSGINFLKIVKGNGIITTKTHTTLDYHKVNVVGSMDVILEKGTEGTIRVTTDENIHQYVIIESNKGVLKVGMKSKSMLSRTFYLDIISDTSAVLGGIGRGTGDVVRILENGNLTYSGFELSKTK